MFDGRTCCKKLSEKFRFCTEMLAQQLSVNGKQAKISLTTMKKTDSLVECSIITNLTVSDLDENSLISLPVVFTTKEIPIAKGEFLIKMMSMNDLI